MKGENFPDFHRPKNGDWVVLLFGKKPQVVRCVSVNGMGKVFVRCQYPSSFGMGDTSEYWEKWRPIDDYCEYITEEEPEMRDDHSDLREIEIVPTDSPVGKLFEKDGQFGTCLAINSGGLYVVEIKGDGKVVAWSKDDCEQVVPHTIRMMKLTHGQRQKPIYWQVEKGKLKVGDMLMDGEGYRWLVKGVGEGERNCSTIPSGLRRIVTEEVEL